MRFGRRKPHIPIDHNARRLDGGASDINTQKTRIEHGRKFPENFWPLAFGQQPIANSNSILFDNVKNIDAILGSGQCVLQHSEQVAVRALFFQVIDGIRH
jgi:hypothetical protein